ncbi:MAG TPA: response regulator, partial [Actinoplanes sp.]|nr:response regulator [Actinoplanes sp.]
MSRILLAEDEPDIRQLVTFKLERAGFAVTSVTDGPAALRAAAADTPDLALLDVRMPGVSGLDVCRELRADPRTVDMPIIMVTARSRPHDLDEAWAAGATEICMQGGIHPDLPGAAYFDLAREVKRRQPGIHLHAFSPMEIVNGAARTGLSFVDFLTAAKEAGLDSVPGTAAEILDDDVRWVLTKGKLPTATWLEIIETAHRVGLPTTSTMMYGHVDTPAHWVGHLRTLAAVQDETGGFTEFVLLPFVHHNSPIYLAGVARPGPTVRENRAVHAVARLLLHGR